MPTPDSGQNIERDESAGLGRPGGRGLPIDTAKTRVLSIGPNRRNACQIPTGAFEIPTQPVSPRLLGPPFGGARRGEPYGAARRRPGTWPMHFSFVIPPPAARLKSVYHLGSQVALTPEVVVLLLSAALQLFLAGLLLYLRFFNVANRALALLLVLRGLFRLRSWVYCTHPSMRPPTSPRPMATTRSSPGTPRSVTRCPGPSTSRGPMESTLRTAASRPSSS